MVTCRSYLLNKPNGRFLVRDSSLPQPGSGEIRVRTLRTSICQSDVVIYRRGLPRIKKWPAVILHEASCRVDAVGAKVTKFRPGDLVALGCDLPCGDRACVYCGDHGTGDWTLCPRTHATGHEFPGFARTHAILPSWIVDLGPIVKFPRDFDPEIACHLEPLACALEGMTRVNHCIEGRIVVLIGAGSQSAYAVQCAQAMGARKIIVVNRGAPRLRRLLQSFGDERVVGLRWDENSVKAVRAACRPFNEPHFVMVNAPCVEAYRLATSLMGNGTVVDGHAGVKGAKRPIIRHVVDLNNDVHYRLQCYQATHGSSWRGLTLAREYLTKGKLPQIGKMTVPSERFSPDRLLQAIERAASEDSLKVIVDWKR